MLDTTLSVSEIASWLRETDAAKLNELYSLANETRRANVGDAVWLRGLLEISNHCRRNCLYCGARASRKTTRYRMTREEILEGARLANEYQFGTLVIQAGEDLGLEKNFIAEIISEIKERHALAITLSLGERSTEEWSLWKKAGADRYLLRFETSNRELFHVAHPPIDGESVSRIEQLKQLREIGYEVGSGVMIGMPGQSYDDLARDLALFRDLELDMIGCGPYLPHDATPMGVAKPHDGYWRSSSRELKTTSQDEFCFRVTPDQVPNTVESAFKVVALARILCPKANIPSTTAVATLEPNAGRKNALERGANVVMPNLTPRKYRKFYDIYPNKASTNDDAEETRRLALKLIAEMGRFQGTGAGSSPHFQARRATNA